MFISICNYNSQIVTLYFMHFNDKLSLNCILVYAHIYFFPERYANNLKHFLTKKLFIRNNTNTLFYKWQISEANDWQTARSQLFVNLIYVYLMERLHNEESSIFLAFYLRKVIKQVHNARCNLLDHTT